MPGDRVQPVVGRSRLGVRGPATPPYRWTCSCVLFRRSALETKGSPARFKPSASGGGLRRKCVPGPPLFPSAGRCQLVYIEQAVQPEQIRKYQAKGDVENEPAYPWDFVFSPGLE